MGPYRIPIVFVMTIDKYISGKPQLAFVYTDTCKVH